MFVRELIEDRSTVKPVMHNGRKVYKHDFSDKMFASEKMARDDERRSKPVTTQKLRTFGGKSSDVQMPTEINNEELKRRFAEILNKMGARKALKNLEKNFQSLQNKLQGDLDKMDKFLSNQETKLGIDI